MADSLLDLVQQFWVQEEPQSGDSPLSAEDKECEEFFVRTHSRQADGRYIVRLPIRSPLPDLSATRRSAIRLLINMERRFSRDAHLALL